jgi:hypothetical protein
MQPAPLSIRLPRLRHMWVRQAGMAKAPKASTNPAVTPLADALSSTAGAIRKPVLAAEAQAAVRELMARLAPKELETEALGLYGLAGKVDRRDRPERVARACEHSCGCEYETGL